MYVLVNDSGRVYVIFSWNQYNSIPFPYQNKDPFDYLYINDTWIYSPLEQE